MARLLPGWPAGRSTPEALRVLHSLKRLGGEVRAWQPLPPWQEQAPDFLLINPRGQALLLKASPAA